ncbi:MAG: dienelactone hydrolase family protein [Acidimicrobiia bacterium]
MGNVHTEDEGLTPADGPLSVIVAAPIGPPRGGVVVIQEAFGLTGHIRRVTEAVAEAGYLAVAPALFHRSEEQVFGYGDFERLGPVIMTLTAATIEMDVDAALSELARLGIEESKFAMMGFCMGGTITLATAARRPLGAAITFYGGGIAESRFGLPSGLDSAAKLQSPWLGLYGDLDAHIPVADVEQLRVVAATASVDTEVVRYADADHGFHCDERPSFEASASADAWARTLRFLDEHLG